MVAVTSVVTLAQTKEFLNITNTASDTELPFYMSAATSMWARRGGPVGEVVYADEWFDGGAVSVTVRHTPISSIQSVVETFGAIGYTLAEHDPGTSGSAWGYSADLVTGTITKRAAGIAVPFSVGVRNVHVSYTAGYASGELPEDVQLAVLLLIKHMWETQRGLGRRPGTGGNDDFQPKESFTWPNRVEEILAGYQIPGIA